MVLLYSEDFQVVLVTDCDPVWLSNRPLHLIDLTISRVSQDGYIYRPWHLLYIPNQCLMIISYRNISKWTLPSSYTNEITVRLVENSLGSKFHYG